LEEIFIGSAGRHPASRQFEISKETPGSFGHVAHEPGIDRGIYVGFDPDGRLRVLISVPHPEIIRRAFNLVAVSTVSIDAPMTIGFEAVPQALPLKLLMFHEGAFVDATDDSGLAIPLPCVSAVGADFDNDSDIDLYLVCAGNIRNYPNIVYLNDGAGHFAAVPDAAGAQGTPKGLRDSAAVADYDRDGFVDLAVTNGRALSPVIGDGDDQIWRNAANDNHWLEIDLEGSLSNRDAIGTRVELYAGGVTQVREVGCDMHLFSQNHRRVHFGLGKDVRVDRLRIYWPSGTIDDLTDFEGDRVLHIVETSGQ
jgi:hypothetical protein